MDYAGKVVRKVRRSQGVSQSSLALRAGTSQSAVSDIERGRVSPTLHTVERLLLCLGHRLRLEAEPLPMDAPLESVAASLDMAPRERLRRMVATSNTIARGRAAARSGEGRA